MPVLIVSEKTWPQDGFSRKRSTRPSSSVTTIPNSSGFVDRLEPDRHIGALLPVRGDQRGQVDVAERVPGDDDEGLGERVAREPHGAGGAQRLLLDRVLDRQSHRLAGAEVAANRLRHEGERDDDVLEPVRLQQLEDVLHARLADDRHHRLRLVRRERPQARALAACHDDGFHGRPTSRRALTTYWTAATSANATPPQKSQTGQSTPSSVTITKPIDAYRIQVASFPSGLTSKS